MTWGKHRAEARICARLLIAKQWVGRRFMAKEFSDWAKEMGKKSDVPAAIWDFHKARDEYKRSGYLRRVSVVKTGRSVIYELLAETDEKGSLVEELGLILTDAWDAKEAAGKLDCQRPIKVGPDTETQVRAASSVKIELAPHACLVERKLQIAMKALDEIRHEDGTGLDMSPAGPCHHIASKALHEIEECT